MKPGADAFWSALRQNAMVAAILERTPHLSVGDWYLTGGAVFQTVWNAVSGFEPEHGIRDYDVFYFDSVDLGYGAEDHVIRAADDLFADLPIDVQVRNQARVHLWYRERFGTQSPPLASTAEGIDRFASTSCCFGVRRDPAGRDHVYAPHGFDDLFTMILRPNPVQAPRWVYEDKAARWAALWPGLTVLPWPSDARGTPPVR